MPGDQPLSIYNNNGLELAFPGLACITTNDREKPYTATGIPSNAHTAGGGAPTRDDTHAVTRSPRMLTDEPAVSNYYMRFQSSDACSTRIYLTYPPNPTDETVVWLCPHLPMAKCPCVAYAYR
jgi:hypothetical protein